MIDVPFLLKTDSYKISHWKQYPSGCSELLTYIESRGGPTDGMVFFGLQMFIEELAKVRVTCDDVEEAAAWCAKHLGSSNVFPYDGWMRVVTHHDGKIPLEIKAVKEGTYIPNHNVMVTIRSTDPELFWITSWMETQLLRAVWYPTTVCTISNTIKKMIYRYLSITADSTDGINFKLHDFGARGVSSGESAGIGGAAHLANFWGSDTMEGIWYANHYYDCDMAGFSIPACYDQNTEILTENGFKLFSNLMSDDKVAQYAADGSIQFVSFTNLVAESYDGEMVRFSTIGKVAKVDLLVTPNHRMVRRSVATGNIEVLEASSATFSQRNKWIQSGLTSHVGARLSEWDRLRIAFQADGSYASHAEDYDGTRAGTIPIRFTLKKDRKKKRLETILKSLGLSFTTSATKNRPGYIQYWIPVDRAFSKTFDWIDVSSVSVDWCREFIEELQYWDGTKKFDSIVYSSSIEHNANIVQVLACISGFRANLAWYDDKRESRKRNYTVCVTQTDGRQGNGIRKESVSYSGKIYCVTVPSGMVVVRRNGVVSISGNSEHSTITSWMKEHERDAYANMLAQFDTPLIAVVSDSYDLDNAVRNIWGKELKQAVIDSGKVVVVRPDSGDPATIVLQTLQGLNAAFSSTINSKGFKVLNNVRVIQGDGIDANSIAAIIGTIVNAGFSLENVAFGMGGALLQHANRDTYKFANKCCLAKVDGEYRHIFKDPATDPGKRSKSGDLDLVYTGGQFETIDRLDTSNYAALVMHSELETVYRNGKVLRHQTLADIRERIDNHVYADSCGVYAL